MRRTLSLLRILLLCAALPGTAQQLTTDISELAAHAGIVFRGTVLSVVAEDPSAPGEMSCVRIAFRVEDGIRGARTGETLTIRQWNVGPDEYRVGEALVLFLYPPSEELGLTSPVGGKGGHRRPGEVSNAALDSLRAPATAADGEVAVAPVRPPRKLPRNPKDRLHEVPQ